MPLPPRCPPLPPELAQAKRLRRTASNHGPLSLLSVRCLAPVRIRPWQPHSNADSRHTTGYISPSLLLLAPGKSSVGTSVQTMSSHDMCIIFPDLVLDGEINRTASVLPSPPEPGLPKRSRPIVLSHSPSYLLSVRCLAPVRIHHGRPHGKLRHETDYTSPNILLLAPGKAPVGTSAKTMPIHHTYAVSPDVASDGEFTQTNAGRT